MKLSISMTRRETLLGWAYLLISEFVLVPILYLAGDLLGFSLSLSVMNILYFVTNFVCVAGIFHSFLWESLKSAWAKRWKCLWCVCKGLALYYCITFLLSFVLATWVGPDFSNVNDETIIELSKEYPALFAFGTVLLVPVVEEIFFRGLLFQSNYRKYPKFAFWLSVLCFAAVHIVDFIGREDLKTLLACFIQYLPAGIALANAYVASDTIATPILMHIIINSIAVTALR